MRRLREKQLEFKGEITVLLSLIFVLLLSFAGAVIQSASICVSKSMSRADTQLALENVFAEYHPELLKRYDIFAREGSEEKGIERRLQFYGADNMKHEVESVELLSDHQGQAFYEQAILAMGGTVPNEVKQEEFPDMKEVEEKTTKDLEDLFKKEGMELPEEDNPISAFRNLKRMNLLHLIIKNEEHISNCCIEQEGLASNRTLQTGTKERREPEDGIVNKILFSIYIKEHFEDYHSSKGANPLHYEIEYLLEGHLSDKENLEAVVRKILAIRLGVNYTYLMSDEVRQGEARVLATVLSSLMTAPEASEVIKQALIFAWAYGESILDMRALMSGNKVPAIKTEESFRLKLTNLGKLGTSESFEEGQEEQKGMEYGDYLQLLLLLTAREELCVRALDLIEKNLTIKVDECITHIQVKSTCKLQRNVTETFVSEYQY